MKTRFVRLQTAKAVSASKEIIVDYKGAVITVTDDSLFVLLNAISKVSGGSL